MKASVERTGVQVHLHLDSSGKKKKEKTKHNAKMSYRHLYTVCGKKHEVVYIPDAFAAEQQCVARKDVKEHLLRLHICKSTGPDI